MAANKRTPYERVTPYITEDEAGCWICSYVTNPSGYPLVKVRGDDGKQHGLLVHRVVYEHLVGPIPAGCHLHHECRVRRCCNPAHLTPLSNSEHGRQHAVERCLRCGGTNWYRFWRPTRKVWSRNCRDCIAAYKREWRARRAQSPVMGDAQ